MIGIVLELLIVIIWSLLILLKKPSKSIVFLLVVSTINFSAFIEQDVDSIIKLLFLFSLIVFVIKRGMRQKFMIPLAILALLLAVNLCLARYDNLYTMTSAITACTTLFTGFLFVVTIFRRDEEFDILSTLSFLPLISMGIGIILWPFGLLNPFSRGSNIGLAGASSSTNLAFFCVISIFCSFFINKKYNIFKYRILGYANFFILLGTLTRGGILAGGILILFDLPSFINQMLKTVKRRKILFATFIIMLIPSIYVAYMVIERSFSGGELNTSGRIEAWEYIISLCQNKWFGNGYGFLKTRDDYELRAFTAAHNEYVHLYLEIGIIGIFILCGIICYLFKYIVKNNSEMKLKKQFVLSIALAFAIYSFVDNTLTNYHFFIPFMLSLALLSQRIEIPNEQSTFEIEKKNEIIE